MARVKDSLTAETVCQLFSCKLLIAFTKMYELSCIKVYEHFKQ